jgi:hypothetical protein
VLVQVDALLLPSVAVSVTVLGPRLAHAKLVGIADSEGVPQLSLLLLSTSAAVMLALPMPSSQIEMLWQAAVGSVESTTVTVLVQVEALLLPSVAVSVTVLGPRLVQLKLVGIAESEGVPQLSLLLLSTSAAVMLALPLPSSQIEMF